MHPTTLATLRGQALDRITSTAKALYEHLDLNPALLVVLTPAIKNPEVKELRRLEGIGDLLTSLALKIGALKDSALVESAPAVSVDDSVTTKTPSAEVPSFEAEAVVPADEASAPAKSRKKKA